MGSLNDVWLQKIKEFRGLYLGENLEVTDNFLLDSLEALCRENIAEYVKLQILFALQEKVSSMIVDTTSIECAVGSLKDMFLHPSSNPSQLYLSQLLVTGSCLVISSDLLVKSSDTFVKFVGVLTDVIEKAKKCLRSLESSITGMDAGAAEEVNNLHNLLVRKTACECLWELELNYPGLLQSKLNHFYRHCEHESSPIFQSYLILFVTVLHHTIEHLASKSYALYGLETQSLNKLLTDHSEPMKPLVLPSNVSGETFPLALHSPPCGLPFSYLPEKVDSKELKRAVSFLMENIGFLNTTSLFYVMLELMHCVKLAGLSPITFKSQFIQWLPSTDICVFHMLLFMKLKFSMDMFREEEDMQLLQRLLVLATQPTLQSDLRLLSFKWLMHFPEELCKSGRAPTEPTAYAFFIDDLQIRNFYPTSFDNIDIIQDKLKLLCLYLWSNDIQETNVLMDCLSLINKQVLLGIGGKSVRALFRSLLWYYTYLHETSLAQDIYRLIMSVITKHPKFMPHVVDFLDTVTMVTPDSPFPMDLLRVLSQHVVSQPVSAVLPNLPHHLKLLAQTMRKSSINPSSTVQFLNQILLTSEISSQGSWSLGNGILAVCHSIFLHQDTRQIVRDLGNLLLYMSTTYQDIDIRDRARFYYSLLANVSSKKASKILTPDTTMKQSLHVMADITTTSFSTAPPVQHIKTSFLKLTRVPKDVLEPKKLASEAVESTLDLQPYGLLGHYCKMINDNTWNRDISIDYYVHYADPQILTSAPSRLYALVLQIDANKTFEPIQDIHIPSLSAANSSEPKRGCQKIKVKFTPREPVPARFDVRAVFQNETGLTCSMVLDQLEIRFSDLFVPLRLPEMFQKENMVKTKKRLFTDLWESVKDNQKTIETLSNNGAMSVVCLSMEWEETQNFLQKQFQAFIIDSKDNEVHVGIFLPPRQHLLLKLTTRNKKTVVAIATDDWRILGLVEKYLREIEQQ